MATRHQRKKKVPLNLCEVGDELAEDVFNRKGQKVVSGETELSEKLLKRLTAAGVHRVTIHADEEVEEPDEEPAEEEPPPAKSPEGPRTRETEQGMVIEENLSENFVGQGNVTLEGDLEQGAVLSSQGNVEILGEVKDGTIRALSGQINVQGEIVSGGEKVQLISNRPIQVSSVVNSHLSVRGPLIVRGTVENARIECQGNLIIHDSDRKAALRDSEVEVQGQMLADRVLHKGPDGSVLHFRDPDVVNTERKQKKVRSKIDRLETEMEKLKSLVDTVTQLGDKVKSLPPEKKKKLREHTEKYKKAQQEIENANQNLEELEDQLKEIQNERRFFMRVLDLLQAGTTIDYEDSSLKVGEDESNVELYKKGVIVIKDASDEPLQLSDWIK